MTLCTVVPDGWHSCAMGLCTVVPDVLAQFVSRGYGMLSDGFCYINEVAMLYIWDLVT